MSKINKLHTLLNLPPRKTHLEIVFPHVFPCSRRYAQRCKQAYAWRFSTSSSRRRKPPAMLSMSAPGQSSGMAFAAASSAAGAEPSSSSKMLSIAVFDNLLRDSADAVGQSIAAKTGALGNDPCGLLAVIGRG